MKVQVIVKKDDRVWDAIRDTDEVAMFRVTEHMKKDHNPVVNSVGDLAQWKLLFGKGITVATDLMEAHGFTVEVKNVNPTI